MMTRASACLLALTFLWACTRPADQPAEPVWGKQACDHCMMLISERPPAAQLTLPDGTRKFFDDVGCMIAWQALAGAQPAHAWVHAADGAGWLDAHSARYRGGQRTPMDYGYLPGREGISFEELAQTLRARHAPPPGAM